MAATGPRLQLAGFDVRVPELSRRASTPSLRIFVDAVSETAVGANQLADVRWSARVRRCRAHRGRDRAPRQGSAAAHPLGQPVDRRRPGRSERGGRGARRTRDQAATVGRGDAAATRSASKIRRSRVGSRSTAAAGLRISSRPRATSRHEPARAPKGFVGQAPQLPGRSPRVARLPRCGRARRLPRARHGTRQDADPARAPARGQGRRARTGDRAAGRRRELDGGSRALHPEAARERAPRREPGGLRRDRGASRRRPTSSSRPTARRCATSRRSPRSRGHASCSTKRR